jgi:hypothetical protein
VRAGRHRSRRRFGVLALVAFALASAYVVQGSGNNQNSHYALIRALADGEATIDAYRAETEDVAWLDGHYYSVRAPGVALAGLAPYLVLERLGAADLPTVWALGVWCALLPALVLLVLVARMGDAFAPGYGIAAAGILGLATLLLPFSMLLFAHALSATLAFAAFFVLWRERGARSRGRVALAGLLAGLAVTVEYPTGLVALLLAVYALGTRDRVRRLAAYAGGLAAGLVPLAAYNLFAFGSVTHISYRNAVLVGGATGHDVLGANDAGFFGVEAPSLRVALELFWSPLGLLVVTPVVAAGVAGVALLARERRAEALLIGGVAVACLVYNAGYVVPFGGATPGPRFLVPALPFLAAASAVAVRRAPGTCLALGSVSLVLIGLITATGASEAADGLWDERVRSGAFVSTAGTYGLHLPRALAVLPFFGLLLAAAFLVARATGPVPFDRGEVRWSAVALGAWAAAAIVAPGLLGDEPGQPPVWIVAAASAAAVAGVVCALAFSRRSPSPRVVGARSL